MSETMLVNLLDAAFGLMPDRPGPLRRRLDAAAMGLEITGDVSEEDMAAAVAREGPVRSVVRKWLAAWDCAVGAHWTEGTRPNTEDRRRLIYSHLAIGEVVRMALDRHVGPFLNPDSLVVISGKHERWYSKGRQAEHGYYWNAYCGYLRGVQKWPEESIADIDESSRQVVERLTDPCRPEAYSARGLVVGYVQSGKTANITAVIAKAADAGYRMFIVLSGTTNLLRGQTQRRLDRELLGQENIRAGDLSDDEDADYTQDEEWGSFLRHGGRPSSRGAFDWMRLTGEKDKDYRRLKGGIGVLDFVRVDPARPLFDPVNLHRQRARLMVVKKNVTVLGKLVRDLKHFRAGLKDVPTLVIDDESDQASVNTLRRPAPGEQKKRTATNGEIVTLLKLLPRGQYVGYTATPFANVFIDAGDAEDLFPRDFILALSRPKHYMGAVDFHDLDRDVDEADTVATSNRLAYVRDIRGEDEVPENLPRAIDSFILSGAIKLFREEKSNRFRFKHHTMLVHSSERVARHSGFAKTLGGLLERGGYASGSSFPRLNRLLEEYRQVWRHRGKGLPFPGSMDELLPFVGRMLSKLMEGEPVLVVNSTETGEDPDFNSKPVWKILVGGAKLSRGYTVEGLTVSYFRRTARASDTLMQMGRWFGFRRGYQDLVRLFIGRSEGKKASDPYDLYEAFEIVCRDEEAFRRELTRYGMPEDGREPITPMQVPPLVASHASWIRPTARNKMFNAEIDFRNFGSSPVEKTLAPEDAEGIGQNIKHFRLFFQKHPLRSAVLECEKGSFDAYITEADHRAVTALLGEYVWADRRLPMQLELEFMRGDCPHVDPEIDDWVVIAPKLKKLPGWHVPFTVGGVDLTVKFRARIDGRVKAYSEPVHRAAAECITGASPCRASGDLERLIRPRRAVLLFYPCVHDESPLACRRPTMGFALQLPGNHSPRQIGFKVRDPNKPDVPVVLAVPGSRTGAGGRNRKEEQ